MEARPLGYDSQNAIQAFYDTSVDEKCELYNGQIVMMAEPSDEHQRIALALTLAIGTYVRGKSCVLRYEESVELIENEDTIVVPDIIVVCDKSKIRPHGIVGAPDLIIEIASPSTASHDAVTKFNKYKDAGVREYWIVNPLDKYVSQHLLNDGSYTTQTYGQGDKVKVHVLDDCVVDLTDVFPQGIEIKE